MEKVHRRSVSWRGRSNPVRNYEGHMLLDGGSPS